MAIFLQTNPYSAKRFSSESMWVVESPKKSEWSWIYARGPTCLVSVPLSLGAGSTPGDLRVLSRYSCLLELDLRPGTYVSCLGALVSWSWIYARGPTCLVSVPLSLGAGSTPGDLRVLPRYPCLLELDLRPGTYVSCLGTLVSWSWIYARGPTCLASVPLSLGRLHILCMTHKLDAHN